MDPDHVWATRAEFDAILVVPDFRFGLDPTDRAFGGHIFAKDWEYAEGKHNAYWDGTYDDNPVRSSIAGITTGRLDEVDLY